MLRGASLLATCALASSAATAAIIQPSYEGLTWKFAGSDFYSPVQLDSAVYHAQSPAGVVPESLSKRGLTSNAYYGCTVISLDGTLTSTAVEKIVESYAVDDVWSSEQFLSCIFVQYAGTETSVSVDASFADFLSDNEVEMVLLASSFDLNGFEATSSISVIDAACDFDNGPYLIQAWPGEKNAISLTPVYRLHPDTHEAFMFGSYPDATGPGKHQALQVSIPGTRQPSIIVPSRLSSTAANAGPLAGLRYAVKDIFHVDGLKTSGGSRAYYEAYGYQNYSTETVQMCEDAGASLVGKLRTITFALGTPRNGMSVDYLDPWNARGDGYQSTGGSSSGSGAAVVAYDWVDFTLGSDTGGSVRFPARFGGIYGYKPTHGLFNLTGILPAIAEQDTPGFLARSPEVFTRVGKVWANGKPFSPLSASLPKKMLRYSDQPLIEQEDARALIDAFFLSMAEALGLRDEAAVNITAAFLEDNVSASPDGPEPPAVYLEHVYMDQNNVQSWDDIGAPLAEAYAAIPGREGAFPPLEPPVNYSWTDGQDPVVRERYPESQRRRQVFGDWFNEAVLPADEETCSEYLFAHSYHIPPDTVKTDPATAGPLNGWWDGVYTNYAGTPEIVVPIGQVRHYSEYTRRMEWQAVTVALGVAKGCDLVLFEVVDRLAELGLLEKVMAGVVAYPVEEAEEQEI